MFKLEDHVSLHTKHLTPELTRADEQHTSENLSHDDERDAIEAPG